MERFNRLEFGMRDDTSIAPTALRFSVGNLVIYKPETAVGWYEGEVVKVSQRMRYSNSHSELLPTLFGLIVMICPMMKLVQNGSVRILMRSFDPDR